MGFPLFRFTLYNAIEGTLEIKEPDGWDGGNFNLNRHEDFHSLIETYSQPLVYDEAQADGITGGMAYIQNIEYTQGVDAIITETIEISEDEGDTWETVYEGVIDIPSVKETDFYKQEQGLKRDDFWSKFINRKSIPTNLQGTTDMDGNARSVVSPVTLALPSQKVRLQDSSNIADLADAADTTVPTPPSYIFTAVNDLAPFDLNIKTLSEIEENFNYPVSQAATVFEKIIAKYSGSYRFVIDVFCADGSLYIGNGNITDVDLYIQKNDDAPILATRTIIPGNTPFPVTPTTITRYELDETLTIAEKDLITIYWEYTGVTTRTMGIVYDNSTYYDTISTPFLTASSYNVYADTVYKATETQAYRLKDAAESIISKCVGADSVIVSDYFDTLCGERYAIMKGLHVRGYSMTEKPFALSFNNWWEGANPIFNLGLGYESVLGVNKIRIEQKDYFYNPTPSLNLDFVNNIERSYDVDKIFKSIEMGYNKWSAESGSGIDDPQSKRTWRTRFATVGMDEKMLSIFIAASLAIEQTRRNKAEQGKDWRLDDDTMIIALNDALNSPEFDENFESVTGLLNSDARYNIRLSVARNFERWKSYFNGCLQIPAGEEFVFASGEGNYDMVSRLEGADCEATTASPEPNLSEKGNVDVTDEFLWLPIVYEFEHPMSFAEYKTIRDNKNNAIGVSRGNSGHKACFIMNLDYKPTRGLGTFTVILGENDPL